MSIVNIIFASLLTIERLKDSVHFQEVQIAMYSVSDRNN
jgi:hypothetical protein